jgi:hypothetical protein
MLTPKIGIGKRLICGPNLVTNPVRQGKISSEDSVEVPAVGSICFRSVEGLFALDSRDRVLTWLERKEGTNGWIGIRTWALNLVSNIVLVVHQESC